MSTSKTPTTDTIKAQPNEMEKQLNVLTTAAPTADDINDIEEYESKTFQTDFSERFCGEFEVIGEYAYNKTNADAASERYRIRLLSNYTDNTECETAIWIGRNELNTVIAALTRAKQFVDGVRRRNESVYASIVNAIDSAEITAVNAKSTQNAAA
ncbi:MAG: hypothetical protein VZQ51_07310 [Bacteroidales bacterium]|nr:hypothetical protein [Bacteroidales bacterium]